VNQEVSVEPKPETTRPPRRWGRILFFLFGAVILALVAIWGFRQYGIWSHSRAADGVVAFIASEKERITALQMADTYGGKTPQETLAMYIAAVEKRDYELASKYFVFGNQEKEKNIFTNISKENFENYISLLKQANFKNEGYSLTRDFFSVSEPLMVDFVKYPNGIWKIVEI